MARVLVSAATYGSESFERASRWVRARAGTESVDRRWFLDPGGLAALVRVVRAEPVLDVVLTHRPGGRRIRAAMRGRTLGVPRNRVCVAVLPIPAEIAERPSGNRNRALRGALNTAARAGVVVRPVPDVAERSDLAATAAEVSPRLQQWSTTAGDHPEDDWWVAEDANGTLRGLAVSVVDADWAALQTLVGFGDPASSSTARFVLHHAVTRDLAARRVDHLAVLDDSPLLVGAGTRHLQRVLGYRLVRLRRPTWSTR